MLFVPSVHGCASGLREMRGGKEPTTFTVQGPLWRQARVSTLLSLALSLSLQCCRKLVARQQTLPAQLLPPFEGFYKAASTCAVRQRLFTHRKSETGSRETPNRDAADDGSGELRAVPAALQPWLQWHKHSITAPAHHTVGFSFRVVALALFLFTHANAPLVRAGPEMQRKSKGPLD